MKHLIKILLAIAIVVIGYFVIQSIMAPIRFNQAKEKRYNVTIKRLKDVRTAQVAFRSVNDRYTGSFDSLITLLKEGKFKVIKQIGSEDDSLAVAQKRVYRETVWVNVRDSLLKNYWVDTLYLVDSLRYIPFSGGKEFDLAAGEIVTASKIKVKVFECKAHNDDILNGLDRQEIVNINDLQRQLERFPGLQVGSMEEATNNAGNWE